MGRKDLVETGTSTTQMQSYLAGLELVTVTPWSPRMLRDSGKVYAVPNGLYLTSRVKLAKRS